MKHSSALSPLVVMILLLSLPAALTGCQSMEDLRKEIGQVPMAELSPGTYEGEAFVFPVKVRVQAVVSGGRLEGLALLEHFNGRGVAAEAILSRILEAQSLQVDAVSGATQSSLTILKAVENALAKGHPENQP